MHASMWSKRVLPTELGFGNCQSMLSTWHQSDAIQREVRSYVVCIPWITPFGALASQITTWKYIGFIMTPFHAMPYRHEHEDGICNRQESGSCL